MKQNLPPLLLTSCVFVSDHSVSLKNEEARIRHTLESIEKWLSISPSLRIVICDGSNFDFSELVLKRFPNARIECLCFQNNTDLVASRGKGYGEGEIVSFALQHSAFIKESECFAKCTAKLWVENFSECLRSWNGRFACKGFFADVFALKKTAFEYVDTRFYIADRSFYLRYFDSAYLRVRDAEGQSLEHCFRDVILENKLARIMFHVPPVICGVGGGTGTYYKNSLKRQLKEKLRLWAVRKNKSFRHFFI